MDSKVPPEVVSSSGREGEVAKLIDRIQWMDVYHGATPMKVRFWPQKERNRGYLPYKKKPKNVGFGGPMVYIYICIHTWNLFVLCFGG